VSSAIDWLNAGASKVVIGTAASPEFLSQVRRREKGIVCSYLFFLSYLVIVSLSHSMPSTVKSSLVPLFALFLSLYSILKSHIDTSLEGWTSPTGQRVENRIRELAPYADTFLVTFVEREGRMGGVDVAGVTSLSVIAKECGVKLTIAGGITTEKDLVTLDRLGCEAQVREGENPL